MERDGPSSPPALGLREEQQQRTRERIVEAAVRILAHDLAELSMKTVAREAGVSRPTLYRHFPSKRALLDGLTTQYIRFIGAETMPPDLDGLLQRVPEIFRRSQTEDDGLRAAIWSPSLAAERRRDAPQRLASMAQLLKPELKSLPRVERDKLITVVTALCSSATRHAFREVTGASGDEAAACVVWAIRKIVAGCRKTAAAKSRGGERSA